MEHRPIIPWMGGKRRLAGQILAKFGRHDCYVEAFAGAAAMFFMKEPSDVEVVNDLNGELVNLYRVVQHHLEEFVRQFKWALSSRQVFEWEKMKRPETLTDIQRAARFFYLQKLSFGARVDGQSFGTASTSGPKLNLLRVEEELSQAHLRLHGAYVENLPWAAVVERYDGAQTLHYLDPPYWGTAGYGGEFGWAEYERMSEWARGAQGAVVISINDHPDVRQCFAGLHVQELRLRHTVGGGAGKEAGELVIWNDHCHQRMREQPLPLFEADLSPSWG